MSYGFRLFELTLFDGGRRTSTPFTSKGTKSATSWDFSRDFATVVGGQVKQTHHGLPKRDEVEIDEAIDEDDERLAPTVKPVFQVTEFEMRGRHALFTVESGRPSGIRKAIPAEGSTDAKEIDLSLHVPARPYRAFLILPTKGDHAVLAVETYGLACPVTPIIRWFNRWSRNVSALSDTDDAIPSRRWRLKAQALTDAELLRDTIKESKSARVVLRRHGPPTSRTRGEVDLELVEMVRQAGFAKRVSETVRNWFEPEVGGTATERATDDDAVVDLAALIGNEVENLDFDEGFVVIEDQFGRERRVNPGTINDVFTYKMKDPAVEPTSDALRKAVRKRVKPIARARSLNITWDQWMEEGS